MTYRVYAVDDGVDKPKENNAVKKKKYKHKNLFGLAAYGHLIGILWPRGGREGWTKKENYVPENKRKSLVYHQFWKI